MSLPISGHPWTELEGRKEHPPNLKSRIKSFVSQLTPLHRALLAVLILSQLLLVLFINGTPLLVLFSSQSSSSKSPALPPSLELQPDKCDSRRIYVYDLPPIFNYELKNNHCNQANYCNKFLNDDFGPAARELAGIVPESVLPAWYWTDVYWGDVLFHRRMRNYKCRTLEPESATAFYIPFYAGLAVEPENHWRLEMFIKSIQEESSWKRSNGADHFIMLGRPSWDFRQPRENNAGWGSSFLSVPEMVEHVIHLSLDRSIWDILETAVPYPTIFHPRSESDIIEWQSFVRSHKRNHLFTFLGGARESIEDSFRGNLRKQCLDEPTACRHVDCYGHDCGIKGMTAMMAAFLDSDFCLQEGVFSEHSVLECMLAGSIPVFFSTDNLQYELFMPVDPESYSIVIHHDNAHNMTDIKRLLERYGREEVERTREKIVQHMPRFVYAQPSQGLEETRDAFDIAIEGVLSKYKAHMEKGRSMN